MSSMRGPLPGCVGDEMPGALPRRAVDPPRREAERVELRAKDVADLAHAREVLRAAVDVDDALEQRERLGVVRVDRLDDCPLAAGERRRLRREIGRSLPACHAQGRDKHPTATLFTTGLPSPAPRSAGRADRSQ